MIDSPIRKEIFVKYDDIPATGKIVFVMLPDHDIRVMDEQCIDLPWLIEFTYVPTKFMPGGGCLFRLDKVRISK